MEETFRDQRGHVFLPPPEEIALPSLEQIDDTSPEEIVLHLHYYCADGHWWIATIEPDWDLAFGYVRLNQIPESAEWGCVRLGELERLAVAGNPVVLRDLDFTPTRFADLDTQLAP